MTSEPSMRRAWLTIVLLWFVAFSNFMARMLPTTMHSSLVAAIPMTEAQFGLLTSALFAGYGIVNPIGGFLGDRFSRSGVIIGSMAVWSVVTWITSYARTYEQLLTLRFLTGLSEGCYLPTALALISDYHKGSTRSLATGIHQTGYAIGMALSGLGGWLADIRNWHFAFGIVGKASAGYSVVLLLLLRDAPRDAAPKGGVIRAPEFQYGELGRVLVSAPFLFYFFASALTGSTLWTVSSWLPVFLQERFHLTQGVAGLTAAGYLNAAAIPGLLIGGAWADRWGRATRRSFVYVPVIGLLVASVGLLFTANSGALVQAILGIVLFRLFFAFVDTNGMPMLCQIVEARYRGTIGGTATLAAAFTAGIGIYFSGVFMDMKAGLDVVFDVVAVAIVVCAALLYAVKRYVRA